MEKIKFTKEDKQAFIDIGHCNNDIKQIMRLRYTITDYTNDISFDEACKTLGRINILSAIDRAAFHSSGSINENWHVTSNLLK